MPGQGARGGALPRLCGLRHQCGRRDAEHRSGPVLPAAIWIVFEDGGLSE